MISINLKTILKRLKNDLKECVDVKITSLEKISKFMLETFIGIILTPVSIILTKLL